MISTQENLFQSIIHPGASMGAVQLTVSDLARAVDFYRRVLGFRRESAALRSGKTRFLDAPGKVLAFTSRRPRGLRPQTHPGLLEHARRNQNVARPAMTIQQLRYRLGLAIHLFGCAAMDHREKIVGPKRQPARTLVAMRDEHQRTNAPAKF